MAKKPKRRSRTVAELTDRQRRFVVELLASDTFCPTEAARKVGYKNPAKSAYRMLQQRDIAEALGRAQREREARCQLKGDDVLNFLRAALFLNPLQYFAPSPDGGWLLTDPATLPEEVGRLIESMDVKVIEGKDGARTSTFAVKLVSKTHVLGLAMKHLGLLPDKVAGVVSQVVQIDWASLSRPSDVPAFEQRIEQMERLADSYAKQQKGEQQCLTVESSGPDND
jgi:phage terminase small subunit